MKRYSFSMAIILGLSQPLVYANLPTTINQYPTFKIHKEPLMISHLPENMAKKLKVSTSLTYASGHEFYDAAIELEDETGKKINYQYQMDPKQQYTLTSTGQVAQTVKNIWFFSPNGSDPIFEDDFDLNQCTAENPCKQLTQQLIDAIDNQAPNANLWFAPGTYDLPSVVQQKLNPQLLELHHKQTMMGRSADFRHFVYEEDRPLFLGTLSWRESTGYKGISDSVKNIRMHIADNNAQIDDTVVNTNLYSVGHLYIANCSLENISDQNGSNIYGKNIEVYQSSLEGRKVNIESRGDIEVQESILKVKGSNVSNLVAFYGDILALNSRLIVENEACSSQAIENWGFGGSQNIYLESVKLNISSEGECDLPFVTSAIQARGTDSKSSFIVNHSKIKVLSRFGIAVGIMDFGESKISLSNSKMTVQSLENTATGIAGADMVEFLGNPSFLKISSPVSAYPFTVRVLLNNSTPPSQCSIDEGEMQDCQLP